ncbi:MAG: hypothetical protein ISS55_08925 [Dehalococcoidales bacterium]|nr:hypothetical protein [Dehalococcoidales bacterium]
MSPSGATTGEKNVTALETCPVCGQKALFWNERASIYECLNRKCRAVVHSVEKIGMEIDQKPQGEKPSEEEHGVPTVEVSNTLLLAVKMFLADIRSWRRHYRDGEYVCADFAREVYNRATYRGIRCGYVVVRFRGTDTRHAIVVFETDYGLKYFEPQTGDEEEMAVGRRYSVALGGIPEDCVISGIHIEWNDGTTTTVD